MWRVRGAGDPPTEHTGVRLAHEETSPIRQVARRLAIAALVLLLTVVLVYADRRSYRDAIDGGVSLLDAFYYATVTLSTTGYGDITPVTEGARLFNALVITPLRVLFLIVLIGTTLEALTARSREELRVRRFTSRVRRHVVVCGYGTKGRNAVRALRQTGTPPDQVVVVDADPRAIEEANAAGYTGVVGDAGRGDVLARASVRRARAVVVAVDRDDAAVLITLTARRLNPEGRISTSVREEANASLLRQSGADTVLTTSATSGRLLGLAPDNPRVVAAMEDLLEHGVGLDLHERPPTAEEVGQDPRQSPDVVLSVVRDGGRLRFDDPQLGTVRRGDLLVVVRSH
ncbi:potassium channel family protein [Geodermatophilus sp. SYSU D00697]